jgi:type II secretory pathway pseudopilin PulG
MTPAIFWQLRDQKGSALLIVLIMIVIIGFSAGIAGMSWRSLVQRADEAELFWRGDQYRQAIQSYYTYSSTGAANPLGQFPPTLEHLIKDPRSLEPKKHIRRLYLDPITGGDWTLIKDKAGRITGVRSSSDLLPFQQDGFPLEYEDFAGAGSYSAWEFNYMPKKETSTPSTRTGVSLPVNREQP